MHSLTSNGSTGTYLWYNTLMAVIPYFIYILECADGSLYTGIATDLEKRLKEHKSGKGAKYTRARGVKKIAYSEQRKNRSEALKRELEIKAMTRREKLILVKNEVL